MSSSIRRATCVASVFLLAHFIFAPRTASAAPIESWENTLDGWTVVPSSNPQPFLSTFSSTTGVTDGQYSLAITGTGTSGPNYGQLLISPSSIALTQRLGSASAVSFDVYTPPASFGYNLQFDVDIYNSDVGFPSLDGFNYLSTLIGSEHTITVPVSSSLQAELLGSFNPTSIYIQAGGGFSDGNETMYLDNLTTVDVPEPATLSVIGFGVLLVLRRRGRTFDGAGAGANKAG